ncbi:lipopolysaccharide biosynthesis protein [Carnobacterium jeotgali]|uniref:lipopolysaccharide biosynthesis protein n=1 Tax=Carnobacterium jeotgali TaxID=545534 RepID=UPI001E4A9116|nr:lipopolysaccharide biosynthesis protein [Carnobacterium jeotgali]
MADEFKKGIFYSAIGKYSNVVIQLLVTAVLSRILTPAEYGIVAVVNVFLIFFQMLADFGIGPAIIQNKSLEKEEINSIFGFSLYLALFLGIVFMFLGHPISAFYNNEVYKPISIVLAICVFFYGILVVPQSMLLRDKKFSTVNMVTVLANIVSGVVSIVMAINGFSYYSLIISNTAKAALLFIIFYLKTNLKASLKIDKAPLKKIFSFSKNQFLFNFINYFSRNLDSLLIGRYFSASSLAFYDKAYQVSLYPNQILTNVISPVIQPIMSDYEKNLEKIKSVYLKITTILATIGLPLSVFLVFHSSDIILFLFGDQWSGSVVTFQILALSVWIQMILSSTGAIFQSANRTDLLLLSGVLSAVVTVTAIFIGIWAGKIEYVALMVIIAFTVNFIQTNYLLMYRLFNSNFIEFGKALVKPVIMAIIQGVFFVVIPRFSFSSFVNLMINGIAFVILFIIGLILTGQMKLLKEVIKKK